MEFYSYIWLREDGTPLYVGKGSGNRAYTSKGHRLKCPTDKARIMVFPMLNEAEAFESEVAIIELFGRKDIGTGCLWNLTDGGENPPNWTGRKRGAEFSAKLAQRNRERGQSEAAKEKIRAARIGTKWTDAARAKMSATRTGVPHSAEWSKNISLALKARAAARRQAQEENSRGNG